MRNWLKNCDWKRELIVGLVFWAVSAAFATPTLAQTLENGVRIMQPSTEKAVVPNLKGVVIGVKFEGGRNIKLEGDILQEFNAFGTAHLQVPMGFKGDPCIQPGQPVVCVLVSEPHKGISGYESSYSNISGQWGSSSSSQSGEVQNYSVTINLWLYTNSDGGQIIPLASDGGLFSISNGTSYFGSWSFGGGASSTFSAPGDVTGQAMRTARGVVKHILHNKKEWQPNAAETLQQAFRR